MSILHNRQQNEILPLKKTFEDLAYFAEDKRRSITMDPERFQIEQSFIDIMREFIQVQQELAQNMKTAKSVAIVKQLEG